MKLYIVEIRGMYYSGLNEKGEREYMLEQSDAKFYRAQELEEAVNLAYELDGKVIPVDMPASIDEIVAWMGKNLQGVLECERDVRVTCSELMRLFGGEVKIPSNYLGGMHCTLKVKQMHRPQGKPRITCMPALISENSNDVKEWKSIKYGIAIAPNIRLLVSSLEDVTLTATQYDYVKLWSDYEGLIGGVVQSGVNKEVREVYRINMS